MQQLVRYQAPTYLLGIDETTEKAFIISVHEGGPEKVSSLSTKFELDCRTLELLWKEVKDFWDYHDLHFTASNFSS